VRRIPIRKWTIVALLPALAAGCAGGGTLRAPSSGTAADAPAVRIEMRRTAEVAGSRGELRLFDAMLQVEYRHAGRGSPLDAGAVTLAGLPLEPHSRGSGAEVVYRAGPDELRSLATGGASVQLTLANSGGAEIPAAQIQVLVAPFPSVREPFFQQSLERHFPVAVWIEPSAPEVWHRISLQTDGGNAEATPTGPGRWEFRPGSLTALAAGAARLRIETETSCASCGDGPLRARWSTRSELELPVRLQ
jgi:hypothetical protein